MQPPCNRKSLIFLIVCVLFSTFPNPILSSTYIAAAPENLSAKTMVVMLHKALLTSMMQSHKEEVKNRYLRLKPLVDKIFHNEKMVQITSGSLWKTANTEEKRQLTSQFARLTAATYASQFTGYSGQKFSIVGEQEGPQETTLIRTKIISPNGKSISLVYVLKNIKGEMGIIDILLDVGISELAKKRSEFRNILKKKGLAGLIGILKVKADNLLKN